MFRMFAIGGALTALIIAGGALALRGHQSQQPSLPVLAALPDFSLVDQHGKTLTDQDLRGHVWVADFIFTRCAMVCPVITEKMATLEGATRDLPGLRFVSFSVDPDYDQPPILAAYAAEHHADSPRWSFVTGPADAIKHTVIDGLKVGMEPNPEAKGVGDSVLHGTHFVLVDETMHIRGYYDSSDAQAVASLANDVRSLSH